MLMRPAHLAQTGVSFLLLAAVFIGAAVGQVLPEAGRWLGGHIDATLLALIFLLFFGVRADAVVTAFKNLRFIGVALLVNFLLVPPIGYGISRLFLDMHPWMQIGLAIYFMSPCTDWFLGFTRLAGGNVALGAALIPLNMAAQLLLYPFYLQLVSHNVVHVDAAVISDTMLRWFMLPLLLAVVLSGLLSSLLGLDTLRRLQRYADKAVPLCLALLVLEIFGANVAVIQTHAMVFTRLLAAVFVFFAATYLLSEAVGRICRYSYPEHALLTMTVAARNAPLMLTVTMAALPGQPLIYAALVMGMLLEFPHLTVLTRLLLRARPR